MVGSSSECIDCAKNQLTSSQVLTHFNSKEVHVVLSCDASPYGVGAVLAHHFSDGSEWPITFASRTLAPAERNCSQLNKEGLAIIFGVKKFHNFLSGHQFSIFTDHKPLKHLFEEDKAIPPRRWLDCNVGHWYYSSTSLESKMLTLMSWALTTSRLSFGSTITMRDSSVVGKFEASPVNAKQIAKWTEKDPILSKVKKWLTYGWPEKRNSNHTGRGKKSWAYKMVASCGNREW